MEKSPLFVFVFVFIYVGALFEKSSPTPPQKLLKNGIRKFALCYITVLNAFNLRGRYPEIEHICEIDCAIGTMWASSPTINFMGFKAFSGGRRWQA